MHSLFGMADSIGLGLMTSGTTETSVRRIKPLLDSGREKMSSYLAAGCSPETGKFIEFITAQENGREEKDIDSENFKLDMLSAMLNEAVIAASENEGNITEALFDAVGLSENFSFYYKKYGYEKISESLDSLRTYTGISSYETADKKLYDTYFC